MEQYKITSDYDNIDWEKVIKILMAYACSLIENNNEMKKSKDALAYDFVMEAIEKYLRDKSKFDPSRNPDLMYFLKYNYLRQIISNGKTSGKYKYENSYEKIVDGVTISKEALFDEYNIDEQIDINIIIPKIEEALVTDNELLQLFKYKINNYDSKRSDICEDLSISLQEYDNRNKRLKRIVTQITQPANGYENKRK